MDEAARAELGRLLSRRPSDLTDDELITAARLSGELYREGPEQTGRLLAELYTRDRLSWPEIARRTGIRQTTVYRWAQRYLPPDPGMERSPRQGRRTDSPG